MAWRLDTHAQTWAWFEPEKLETLTRGILADSRHEAHVSPISYWKISLKSGLGKIPVSSRKLGLTEAPLAAEVLSSYHNLAPSPDHREPFDRMVIWQCIHGNHTLLSRDGSLPFYKPYGLVFDWSTGLRFHRSLVHPACIEPHFLTAVEVHAETVLAGGAVERNRGRR